jgi:copper(I)-binding protein
LSGTPILRLPQAAILVLTHFPGRFKELSMKNCRTWLALPVAMVAASTVGSALASQGWLVVDKQRVKPLAVGIKFMPTQVPFEIHTQSTPNRLIEVHTSSGRVALQRCRFENNQMRVAEVSSMNLPGNCELDWRNDQRQFLMLLDTSEPIGAGDSFDLTLVFDQSEPRTVTVSVPNLPRPHQVNRRLH